MLAWAGFLLPERDWLLEAYLSYFKPCDNQSGKGS